LGGKRPQKASCNRLGAGFEQTSDLKLEFKAFHLLLTSQPVLYKKTVIDASAVLHPREKVHFQAARRFLVALW
jgi:hypothetical protein